ncbi:MAG: hypothetical protein U0R64_01970 [Candidatus Nanopelagicales bacterium]
MAATAEFVPGLSGGIADRDTIERVLDSGPVPLDALDWAPALPSLPDPAAAD